MERQEIQNRFKYRESGKIMTGVLGALIYSLGMNLFIVPTGLYSGGVMGIAQLIRTFLISGLGLHFGALDIAGIIYYALNIPLILFAFKIMEREFVIRTLITITTVSVALSLIRVPMQPILEEDIANCLIGGITCGFGIGTYLRAGSCGGGLEIVGVYLMRKMKDFSVGKMNMLVNLVIYAVCLVIFTPAVAIYSIIYSFFSSFTIDKVHSQNIRVEAIIISKTNNKLIEENIMKKLHRGITYWNAQGGYTGEEVDVLYTVLTKYEIDTLKRIVYGANPKAFMVIKEGLSVDGNFVKRV